MAGLRTEFPFTLPKGFVDDRGVLHRHGTMRLATARDEIEPLRDRNVTGPDDPYLTVLVLARVITELGALDSVTPADVERFFAADLAFLQDLYGIINFGDPADVDALQASVLPDVVDQQADGGSADAEPADRETADHDADAGDAGDPGHDGTDSDQGDARASAPVTSARRRGHIEEVPRAGSG